MALALQALGRKERTESEMIAYLSELFTLAPGDLILSGTPSGVGPVQPGDRLLGHVDGVDELEVVVTT